MISYALSGWLVLASAAACKPFEPAASWCASVNSDIKRHVELCNSDEQLEKCLKTIGFKEADRFPRLRVDWQKFSLVVVSEPMAPGVHFRFGVETQDSLRIRYVVNTYQTGIVGAVEDETLSERLTRESRENEARKLLHSYQLAFALIPITRKAIVVEQGTKTLLAASNTWAERLRITPSPAR